MYSFIPLFLDDPAKNFVLKQNLKPHEDKDLKIRNYREAWIKEFISCKQDHFIISTEIFTQPNFRKKAVQRLKEFVEQYFEKVTIITYVRHYDQWIPSQIQQAIKMAAER